MTKKKVKKTNLYSHESQLLERVKKIGAVQSISKEELIKEYSQLGSEYEKLLKQVIKITRIGDVSQRKLATQKGILEEKSDKLKELAQIKSRFFANISHEFRTPLSLIIGPLEEMLYNCCNPEERKTLMLMLRNAQRLLGLINQLLELSKFESGGVKLKTRPQDIISFLKGITSCFELLAQQNEVDLIFHSDKENLTLHFEAEKIEEAFCNLLMNALKYTPRGGQIRISVREVPPGLAEISVKDTGPGIPRDQLDFIFDRFYRMDRVYEDNKQGFGIGLALVREYITLHQGEIHVNSREGEGTEFLLRLPLGKNHLKPGKIPGDSLPPAAISEEGGITSQYISLLELEKEQPESITTKKTPPEKDRLKQEVVLVVEDNSDMRHYIMNALESNYQLVEARNGQEGLEVAKKIIPDVIISDIVMPKLDGYELCRKLKNDIATSHVPVILLTAKASETSIIKGLETGADDYITKPFNTKILEVRVRNLIDLRRQLQQKIQRQLLMQPDEIPVSSLDQTFIKKLEEVVETNLSDPKFGLDELTEALHMSKATLYRKVCALTGESPKHFIQSYRLKRAAQLLKSNFGNVTEVAYEVGFSSSSYFTKCFKEKFHQIPSVFQETI